MRIRLLMDVDMSSEDISLLQKLIDDQPSATIQISDGFPLIGARLMGATPVTSEEH